MDTLLYIFAKNSKIIAEREFNIKNIIISLNTLFQFIFLIVNSNNVTTNNKVNETIYLNQAINFSSPGLPCAPFPVEISLSP